MYPVTIKMIQVYQPGIISRESISSRQFQNPFDEKEERGTAEGLTNVRETGGGSRKRSLKNVFHRQSVNRILRGRRATRSPSLQFDDHSLIPAIEWNYSNLDFRLIVAEYFDSKFFSKLSQVRFIRVIVCFLPSSIFENKQNFFSFINPLLFLYRFIFEMDYIYILFRIPFHLSIQL